LFDVTHLKRSYWNKYKNYLSNGKDSELLKNIVKVYEENLKQFGYRRITKYLKNIALFIMLIKHYELWKK
jgi:hypothetical protein